MADTAPTSTTAGIAGLNDPPVLSTTQNAIQKKGAKESEILLRHLKDMIKNGAQSDNLIDFMQSGRGK